MIYIDFLIFKYYFYVKLHIPILYVPKECKYLRNVEVSESTLLHLRCKLLKI